eukprot:c23877_g1_i1 orf=262-1932(+)
MTVNRQEAMVEAQASERIVVPTSGASTATIESLRARLLSERVASKEARQQAHEIAQKVSELQIRLDAEVEHRKKAEAAMKEVLEALKAKGLAMEQAMATNSQQSECSESEEAAPSSSSKDGESEHSSGEDALRVHIGNPQGSVDEALQAVDVSECEEGCVSEDNSSDKTQITLEEISRSDSSEVKKEGINKDEEGSSDAQAVFTDPPKDLHNGSLLLGQSEEEGDIEQSSELLSDPAKLAEGREKTHSNGEIGLPSANHSPCLPSANSHVIPHQEVDSNIAPGIPLANHSPCLPPANYAPSVCLSVDHQVSLHGNEALHPGAVKKAGRPQQNDMSRLGTENVSGVTPPKDMHPGFFPKNGYPYDMPSMYGESLRQGHNVPFSAEVPFPRGFSNTAYQSREHLSSDIAGFGRYPQAPINDAILSLVDDKKGKLGSILMALQLAKQQLNDEEHVSSYMEERFVTPSPILKNGKAYTGFYEEAPHQLPYQPWRTSPHNAAPIIHFPVSPRSDHEVSAFERHDGLRRSSSTSAYYMPPSDVYLQPKGELHLGNGITLYTD